MFPIYHSLYKNLANVPTSLFYSGGGIEGLHGSDVDHDHLTISGSSPLDDLRSKLSPKKAVAAFK